MIRTAIVFGRDITRERVAAFLPANYRVVDADITGATGDSVVIEGTDNAGWTLDDYVMPRLASGLLWASEVPASTWTDQADYEQSLADVQDLR